MVMDIWGGKDICETFLLCGPERGQKKIVQSTTGSCDLVFPFFVLTLYTIRGSSCWGRHQNWSKAQVLSVQTHHTHRELCLLPAWGSIHWPQTEICRSHWFFFLGANVICSFTCSIHFLAVVVSGRAYRWGIKQNLIFTELLASKVLLGKSMELFISQARWLVHRTSNR